MAIVPSSLPTTRESHEKHGPCVADARVRRYMVSRTQVRNDWPLYLILVGSFSFAQVRPGSLEQQFLV